MADTLKKPFHEVVAENLIKQLEAGTAPWQKPWEPGETSMFLPMNPVTGKRYRGINAIHLMAQGRSDQRWMTYKQADAAGAQVRRGERGTPIQYWKFSEEQIKRDESGNPVRDENGGEVKIEVRLERPRVFFATVFNAEQIDGLPAIERKPAVTHSWENLERVEHILSASQAHITHSREDRAFYRPSTDSIQLPEKSMFPNAANYYAIAMHELGHWTGHPSRLARDLVHPFGSEGYAKEELRAEIASMILGDELGIGRDPGQHAAYVNSWIKVLKEDPLEIFRAAADAEKIQEFVLAFEQKQVQERDTMQAPQQSNQREQSLDQEKQLSHQEDSAGRLIDRLVSAGMTHGDADVASALRDVRTATPVSLKVDKQALKESSERNLQLTIPSDWTGQLRIHGEVQIGGLTKLAVEAGKQAEFYTLNAYRSEARYGDGWTELERYPSESEANAMRDRLALIDAHSHPNTLERDLRLARIRERAVQENPDSTEEQIFAAKEARKAADAALIVAQLSSNNVEQVEVSVANAQDNESAKTYINVLYKDKEEVKALGGKWDRQERSWYIPPGVNQEPFSRWLVAQDTQAQASSAVAIELEGSIDEDNSPKVDTQAVAVPASEAENNTLKKPLTIEPAWITPPMKTPGRQYLAVPYADRFEARKAGAEFDGEMKSWYVGQNADMDKLKRWQPNAAKAEQEPALNPQEEFADALRSLGCDVDTEDRKTKQRHPIMDGEKHRIKVEGDKGGEASGFYVAYLDGHPAGYIKNNKSGNELKWKSKGYTLTPEQKAQLQAEAAAKLQARAAEEAKLHESSSQRVTRQMKNLVPVTENTPYIAAKQIAPLPGAFTDRDGQTTFIPAIDVNEKQWSMQYIKPDGVKRFAADSRKEGCFHVVGGGGMQALNELPVLVVGEGYATMADVSAVLGFQTVSAFDSGNVPVVARALRERFPDKPMVIVGDDDQHLIATLGVNPGKTKAELAAAEVGGTTLFPIFAPGEREENPKGLTDFNDLKTKSSLGFEGLERQVVTAVAHVIEQHAKLMQAKEHTQAEERKGTSVGHESDAEKKRARSARM